MLFNSVDFVLFFPLAVGLYFALPHRWRWAWLLAASYGFYAWWRVDYLALIAVSTLVDYVAARRMGALPTKEARRPWLGFSLAANLGLLFAFKYVGFFGETVNTFLALVDRDPAVGTLDVLLPVGISFYTFQTLAYSIDVYRGRVEPERHLGIFALYVSFWPQLVAGPIERARRLLPQFRERHRFDAALAADGLKLMAWGFFLKVVVADRLALIVSAVFDQPGAYHGAAVLAAVYAFAFQIYGDFAGYSLIAIGAARVMGFRLMDNFRQPFLAPTMAELWRRWHVSLTTWFRDYLYAPLVRERRSRPWRRGSLFIVFAATGLWHGAGWTFVLWGAYNGLYLLLEEVTLPWRDRFWARHDRRPMEAEPVHTAGAPWRAVPWRLVFGVVVTFHAFVLPGYLFRAHDLGHAVTLLRQTITPGAGLGALVGEVGRHEVVIAALSVLLVLVVDLVERRERMLTVVARWPRSLRAALYAALVLAIVLFGEYGERPFIYFQF